MKKYFAIILAIVILFSFVACSANEEDETTTTTTATTTTSASTSVSENQNENTDSVVQNSDSESVDGLSNVRIENMNDVTNADGSMNETVIGTTVSDGKENTTKKRRTGASAERTTASASFETDIIPIE